MEMEILQVQQIQKNNQFHQETNHLGTLIGDPSLDRIVAVSTSDVFADKELIANYWGQEYTQIDSGYQGHIYTRPKDTFIVQVPDFEQGTIHKVLTAVRINYEIWKELVGIELASPQSNLVLTSKQAVPKASGYSQNFSFFTGSLSDAALHVFNRGSHSLLAFTVNKSLIDQLSIHSKNNGNLSASVETVSRLMDKNTAMELLQYKRVYCAKTYVFNEETNLKHFLSTIDPRARYVFKPAGGAACIGVYGHKDGGLHAEQISNHIEQLKNKSSLPQRFQVQQYIPGKLFGVTACFDQNHSIKIFEIHEQILNEQGKFIGGRWTAEIEANQKSAVELLYNQLAQIQFPKLKGLINLDFIQGTIIEVNPRLTAAAPIAHMLLIKDYLSDYLSDFLVKQIDIVTNLNIPFKAFQNGRLQNLIKTIWEERRVLVLPQGLNPFGNSRVLFINDDSEGSTQEFFRCVVEKV